MDKYFAAGPLVKLKTVVAFNIDYFGNEKGEVTPKDSPLLSQRTEEERLRKHRRLAYIDLQLSLERSVFSTEGFRT